MSAEGSLGALLRDTRELESFLHDFISQVTRRHPKPGEDVTRRAEELGLKVPAVLRGIRFCGAAWNLSKATILGHWF